MSSFIRLANKQNLETIILLIIGLTSLIVAVMGIFWPINQDEGVFLTIADGIRHGFIPYKDFFDHKPPGIYYVLAPIEWLNLPLWGIRLFLAGVNIAISGIVYQIGKRISSPKTSLRAAVFFIAIAPVYESNFILTETFMAICLAGSLLCFVDGWQKNEVRKFWLSGIIMGLAMLFKQPAIIDAVILGGAILISRNRSGKYKKLGLFIMGIVLAWLPWVVFFLTEKAGPDFWQQVVVLNLNKYPATSTSLVLSKWWDITITSLPIWLLFAWASINLLINRRIVNKLSILLLICVILPLPLLFYRHYPHYWLQVIPFVSLLAAIGLEEIDKLTAKRNSSYLFCVCMSIILLFIAIFDYKFINKTWREKLPLLKRQVEVSKYIKNTSNLSDTIYASRFFTGAYFMADRKSASPFLYLNEINYGLGAEEKTIKDIEENKPKYIVWNVALTKKEDPFASEVAEYINKNYRIKKEFTDLKLTLYEN